MIGDDEMTTLSTYGAKVNRPLCEFDGLSTDQKPIDVFIEYNNGKEVARTKIQNGSKFHEMDTDKRYKYDATNQQWEEV